MDGVALATVPKNSRHTVRVYLGILCSTNAALVMIPSVPSFCTPGRPLKNLSVTSLPNPTLRNLQPAISSVSVFSTVSPSSCSVWIWNTAVSSSWILPKLWRTRSTFIHSPCGLTIFHHARLSSVVPHSTAFLPPAFIATLPPMQDASAEVGSTANTSPAACAASSTRRVTTPAPHTMMGCSPSNPAKEAACTPPCRSSFSVLMTALIASKGMAPPV